MHIIFIDYKLVILIMKIPQHWPNGLLFGNYYRFSSNWNILCEYFQKTAIFCWFILQNISKKTKTWLLWIRIMLKPWLKYPFLRIFSPLRISLNELWRQMIRNKRTAFLSSERTSFFYRACLQSYIMLWLYGDIQNVILWIVCQKDFWINWRYF